MINVEAAFKFSSSVSTVFTPPGSDGGGVCATTFAAPVNVPHGWSLSFLGLDAAEVAELFSAYNDSCIERLRPQISIALQTSILHLCGTHVGLLRNAIVRFAEVFRNRSTSPSPSDEAAFIREELLLLGIEGNLRSLPLLHRLSLSKASWLKRVTLEGPSGLRLHGGFDDALATLIVIGVFDYNDATHHVSFSSRLMQTHALRQLFCTFPRDPIRVTPAMNAIDIAREVVRRLDKRTLCESLSLTATGTLLERQYQMSFFAYVLCGGRIRYPASNK
jgi:hypothetical protein